MTKNLKHFIIRIKNRLFFTINLLSYLLISRIIVNGKILIIPRNYKIDLGDFLSEQWLDPVIIKLLQNKTGAFIDAGVNMGQILVKVKAYKFYQEYYGCEPNPVCYYHVDRLIKANSFPNCKLVPVGLSNKTAIMNLFARDHSDAASLISDFKDSRASYSIDQFIPVFDGDYIVNYFGIKSIAIIKIDVEGSELEVIQGFKNSIKKFRPCILCEVLPFAGERNKLYDLKKERQEKLLIELREQGYKICRILRSSKIIFLNTIDVHSDMSLRDYLFIPIEEKENIKKLLNIC